MHLYKNLKKHLKDLLQEQDKIVKIQIQEISIIFKNIIHLNLNLGIDLNSKYNNKDNIIAIYIKIIKIKINNMIKLIIKEIIIYIIIKGKII